MYKLKEINVNKSIALLTLLLAGLSSVTALAAGRAIETVYRLDAETPPANLAIAPNGRMFMSIHPFYGHSDKVVEVHKDGSVSPYPNNAETPEAVKASLELNGVLGLRVDRRGILWLLDAAGDGHSGKIVGWDTVNESLHQVIYLAPPVVRDQPFLNDLAVDRSHDAIYITDTSVAENAALIVVDLTTGHARRVLEGSAFTRPEDIDMVIDGKTVTLAGQPARIGANPITLDASNTWVYFAPMSGTSLYRIHTSALLDESLSADQLEAQVQRYGDKPISDGSTVDSRGNVYITSVTDNSIGVVSADGVYRTLYQDDEISWPDGFSIGPDNQVYLTVNELHRSAVLNGGKDTTKGKFKIMRFAPLAPSETGR
jgi:sugar lactone lactonase YvrE